MNIAERRKLPRYAYPIEVVIGWGSNTIQALTRNISLRGMFIETGQPLWPRAEFTARLSLPEPIELDCIVKHVEPARGMGVEFKDVPDMEREQLELLVAGLGEGGAGPSKQVPRQPPNANCLGGKRPVK
jgi:hypothetical protein